MTRQGLLYILVYLIICPYIASAIILPKENSILNYRLVGFLVPAKNDISNYITEIAIGNIDDVPSFNKSIVLTVAATINKKIIEVPQFSTAYTWRVIYKDSYGNSIDTTPLYHFSTGNIGYIDTSKFRLHLINPATEHKDMFVILDYSKTMYDMAGVPVWYLPNIPGVVDETKPVRDLKPTNSGTFTFMSEGKAYEIDYNGKLLWSAPDDGKVNQDTSEFYHHDFTKLDNGHYMIAGNEYAPVVMPGISDSEANTIAFSENKNGIWSRKIIMGTLLEYDSNGKLLWSWKSSDHVLNDTLFTVPIPKKPDDISPHMNGFYFDNKHTCIYVSFRNNNTILKIKYPSGKVIASYNGYTDTMKEHGIFRTQHSPTIAKDGSILLFNNNFVMKKGGNTCSYVSVLKESSNPPSLSIAWEFPCNIDSMANAFCPSGGNVVELKDGCFLVNMGTASRSFIVNKYGKILWNVVSQSNTTEFSWQPFFQYRISYIGNVEDIDKYIYYEIN
jgi:hypothetical protein